MTSYKVQDLPSINDPEIIRSCVRVQEMRIAVNELFMHVVSQLTRHPITTPVRVTLAIVDRLVEGALSVEVLCQKNRVRDASILLLSLHELRLDLQYIALDLERADIWLDHTQKGRKPWRVTRQIKEIFGGSDASAEMSIYRQYSMAKHCNPVGETLVFGFAVTLETLSNLIAAILAARVRWFLPTFSDWALTSNLP